MKAIELNIRPALRLPTAEAENRALSTFLPYLGIYSTLDCAFGVFRNQWLLLNRALPFRPGWVDLLWILVAGAGMLLLMRPSRYRWGAALLAAYHLKAVVVDFPLAGNHKYLEFFIYVVIAGAPLREAGELIRYMILSVFFYSGVQKAVHGFYASGEIFALWASVHIQPLGGDFASWLSAAAARFGLPSLKAPQFFQPWVHVPLSIPVWMAWLFRLLGLGTILVEIGLPLLAFHRDRRVQRAAVLLLIGLSLVLCAFTGEYEFASTNLAALFLFFPAAGRWVLPVAAVVLRIFAGILP